MDSKYMLRKKINNQRLRRARSTRSLRRFTIVFLLGLLLVLGMIFSGWVRWKQTELVYRINKIKTSMGKLHEEKKKLVMKLSLYQSPQRCAQVAREKLGLEQVKPEQIILVVLEEEESLTEEIGMSTEEESSTSIESTATGGGR